METANCKSNLSVNNSHANYSINGSLNGSWNSIYVHTIESKWYLLLKESELLEYFEKIRLRTDGIEFRVLLVDVIFNRHFSEEFILKFPEIIDENFMVNDIRQLYKADILSGEYASLALMLKL